MDSDSHLRGRGSTQRTTAPSESCCWLMDTLVLFPRTTDFQCLSHQDIPGSSHSLPRFLPMRNTLARESVPEQTPNNQRRFNVDSEDLLGMGLNAMVSPQFTLDQ
ncbi:hypothetical protein KUCAC02_027466 [Chaenocephalus aceratus]|uniref:Uncharacterized protein n=1 Tax=Chaenocephalus aceratus TaxID=36190 RepID=A0ACB9W511_CHAAC|nr:hypothetical protein KUCAC02_027466 [Chaenocephalus aceratus]